MPSAARQIGSRSQSAHARSQTSALLFDCKALAATALAGGVGVVEHEAGVQALALKVDHGAIDANDKYHCSADGTTVSDNFTFGQNIQFNTTTALTSFFSLSKTMVLQAARPLLCYLGVLDLPFSRTGIF